MPMFFTAILGRCLQCGGAAFQRTTLMTGACSSSTLRSFATRPPFITLLKTTKQQQHLLFSSQQLRRLAVRKEFRRNASDNKRLPKSLKEVKLRDVKHIAVLALPYKRRIGAGLCFLAIGSALFLSLPRILGKLIDEMDESKKRPIVAEEEDILTQTAHFFKNNLLALAAVVVIGACAVAGRVYCMHTASQLIVNDLRTKVFRSILCQDMAFFDRSKVGEIISRLSSDAYIVGYSISSNLGDGVRAIFTSCGSIGMMIYTSKELTTLGCVVIPAIVGAFIVFGKLQTKYTMQMQDAVANTNQLATERLSNIRTVRAFIAEMKELEAYKRKIHEIWEVSKKEGTANAIMGASFYMVAYGFLTSILFYGSSLISQGMLTYGDLSAFMIYAILASTAVSNIQTVYTGLMRGLGASARLFELRDLKPNIPLTGGLVLSDLQKEIRFESVAFAYSDRDATFNDVTFRIPVSSTTAIVGPSGCGKSTIAHLLLRLYTPTLGRIMVDDHDLRELDPSAWRRIIGTVSQEPILFSATIRENILYGVEEGRVVSDEELHDAAKLSNCLDFIQAFPNGFDTMVGEHGASMLSGGQRQRIAIARALIKKPRILILDEATSALDASSEYLVRKALDVLLDKSGQTVLIIAHRLSTIKHADQIVVLDRGTVAELGTFDDLMSIKDGIFYKLVEKQTFDWRDDKF